jgi:hypothetical protein
VCFTARKRRLIGEGPNYQPQKVNAEVLRICEEPSLVWNAAQKAALHGACQGIVFETDLLVERNQVARELL